MCLLKKGMLEKMKKKLKVVIIIAIVLLVALAGTGLCMYFLSDSFKSEKQLFLEYISESKEFVELIKDEDLAKYQEIQKETPYTNNGTVKVEYIPVSRRVKIRRFN